MLFFLRVVFGMWLRFSESLGCRGVALSGNRCWLARGACICFVALSACSAPSVQQAKVVGINESHLERSVWGSEPVGNDLAVALVSFLSDGTIIGGLREGAMWGELRDDRDDVVYSSVAIFPYIGSSGADSAVEGTWSGPLSKLAWEGLPFLAVFLVDQEVRDRITGGVSGAQFRISVGSKLSGASSSWVSVDAYKPQLSTEK